MCDQYDIDDTPKKIFYCVDHDGHYHHAPVASIIVAYSREHARSLLDYELEQKGLKTSQGQSYELIEINTSRYSVEVLHEGELMGIGGYI